MYFWNYTKRKSVVIINGILLSTKKVSYKLIIHQKWWFGQTCLGADLGRVSFAAIRL